MHGSVYNELSGLNTKARSPVGNAPVCRDESCNHRPRMKVVSPAIGVAGAGVVLGGPFNGFGDL